MQQKAFTLINKGMNKDLSVSKTGESSAFDNHNIRIEARDSDTTLSVTNERGNKPIVFDMGPKEILGRVIGWNVLNNHIILFTHDVATMEDRIYRVDYYGDVFYNELLFVGNLNFDEDNPIESVVSFETDDVQKIYWVDGRNVLRFMNFVAKRRKSGLKNFYPWQDDEGVYDNTYFDSNRSAKFDVKARIEKNNSGNSRPNGVTQYLLSYFNKHGQETNYVWMSDLVYLSPLGRGGAADETNNNKVTITFSNLDTSFSHFRVYSVFRSSRDGQPLSYLVYEGRTSDTEVIVSDDGAHLTLQDATRLLYLGSQSVIAGTITHKDDTLFLGDLQSVGKSSYYQIEKAIKTYMFNTDVEDGKIWESNCVEFKLSEGEEDIPYVTDSGNYPYNNQLQYSSSQVLSFKGNEKYRFGLKFQLKDGVETEAFWIGDKENTLYPVVDNDNAVIHRIVAVCIIPQEVMEVIRSYPEIKTVQLVIAEATYADRSVKAQGIINPTMFNTWERYNDRLYSIPSWASRPRNTGIANHHFEAVHKSTETTGEIACNYWIDSSNSHPYFQYGQYSSSKPEYNGSFDGIPTFDAIMIVYRVKCTDERVLFLDTFLDSYRSLTAYVVKAKLKTGRTLDELYNLRIPTAPEYPDSSELHGWTEVNSWEYTYDTDIADLHLIIAGGYGSAWDESVANHTAYNGCKLKLINDVGIDEVNIVNENTFMEWAPSWSTDSFDYYFSREFSSESFNTVNDALNHAPLQNRWIIPTEYTGIDGGDISVAKYRKHLMFVDENIITFNSPEITEEAISIDNAKYKFRIVGVARMTSNITDYNIDAEQGIIQGDDVYKANFSGKIVRRHNTDGLVSWPLWKDYGMKYDPKGTAEDDYMKRKASDFRRTGDIVGYWVYQWGKPGNITGYYDKQDLNADPVDVVYDDHEFSILKHQRIANLHFSYNTIYAPNSGFDIEPSSLRQFSYLSSQTLKMEVNGEAKYYDGIIDTSLAVPGVHKYPIVYSPLESDTENNLNADNLDCTIFTDLPVQLQYSSSAHLVIGFPTVLEEGFYKQTILPSVFDSDKVGLPEHTNEVSGALLPWIKFAKEDAASGDYPYYDYAVDQLSYDVNSEETGHNELAGTLSEDDSYLFIGEVYEDFSENDTRYGGITSAAVESCRFIPAGPSVPIESFSEEEDCVVYGNQGDTFFQRWDCVKTRPLSEDAEYGLTDIVSFLVETHINVEGRTDIQRGINNLTDIDYTTFGNINPVYTQQNNFKVTRDLDEDYNTDSYRSTITWTLPKADLADVDEWTHVTLASSLKLDGDKGICQALRRFNNSLVAFQDKGISEILFNSRTQITTEDGVPVEIGNSGKVDGKRYISNKFGSTNKWSITEGKAGLYFVDSVNKSFCGITVSQYGRLMVDSLSTKLGFSAWFRANNRTKPWNPRDFNNIVSFYDKIHSDIYLVTKSDGDESCLVFNENLGAFTSFFDYSGVSMLANVEDRLVSYRYYSSEGCNLWLQNEGFYCNFFGKQYPFWTTFRAAPEPLADKVFSNLDLQVDFFRVLDENGESVISGDFNLTDLDEKDYQGEETFDEIEVWNEYQTTGPFIERPEKKFRVWRYAIPRAKPNDTNIFGLDRIRNSWVNIRFKKYPHDEENRDLMQLHDVVIKYFE